MNFDGLYQPYSLSRYSVVAKEGMVCSSNSLASSAGKEILQKGGNAVDAAIATAAVLTVVEPTSNGLGGDAFAIVWMKDKLYGLNGSGYAPNALTIDKVKSMGYDKMPKRGWLPVTIPGQPKAWAALSKRFGKLSLSEVLAPAINYAENGFPLSIPVAYLWQKYTKKNQEEFTNSHIFDEWYNTFTKNGEPYKAGDIVTFKNQAKALRLIASSNAESFYTGEIAEKIVEQSDRQGGFIKADDLKNYDVKWVDPINVNYRGYDIWEIPPNGQGIVTLMGLNILKNFDLSKKECVDTYHKQFEAIKMAFSDALANVTDIRDMKVNYKDYLSDEYGKKRSLEIVDEALEHDPIEPPSSGTVYLCSADNEGNMVSFIQSNYMDFGSGIVIEDYGISLQNRGFDFSLNENDVNALAPGKRSYHTIIPGFITKDKKAVGPFGVMGGYMQPQGHIQVAMNYIDFKLNPQMCLDAPRWQWMEGKRFIVEPDFDENLANQLRAKGHIIDVAENRFSFGRGQMIIRLENGVYVGATESRTEGSIACY